jgi:hypothetical protein
LTTKGGSGIKAFSTVHDRTIVILTVLIVLAFTFAVVSAQPMAKTEALLISTSQSASLRPSSHASQSPISVAGSFDADMNDHDSAAASALFADGATASDLDNIAWCYAGGLPGCGTVLVYEGTTRIRGWLDQLVSMNVQLNETQGFYVSGNNVSWTVGFTADPYRKLGIASLETNLNATVDNGKFSSLSIGLTLESIRKLSLAIAASHASPYSAMAGGAAFGLVFLGLVFPTIGVYYVSRVKRLFASVPHLGRPWVLLGGGVGALFVSVLLFLLRDLIGISARIADPLLSVALTASSFLVMSSMILMKRVMLGESGE